MASLFLPKHVINRFILNDDAKLWWPNDDNPTLEDHLNGYPTRAVRYDLVCESSECSDAYIMRNGILIKPHIIDPNDLDKRVRSIQDLVKNPRSSTEYIVRLIVRLKERCVAEGRQDLVVVLEGALVACEDRKGRK